MPTRAPRSFILVTLASSCLSAVAAAQGPPRILGWNDLGMHCMDSDTSIFSILPPFNTFHAQVIVGGQLVTNGSYAVTYEAVADPTGSINRTSIGKSDFWQHSQALFGVTLPLDQGLAGFRMPGATNTPQTMPFHTAIADYSAEGVPVTPYDDTGAMNPYPLMRLVARNSQGSVVATTDIVVPVSAEMACVSCHGTGGNPAARPPSGWVNGPAATDDRLNIVKLHDERHLGNPLYAAALAGAGYSAAGLYDTAVNQGTPVLCAKCHGSNALGTTGHPGVSKLTSAMHSKHAIARLPDGRRLDDVTDRSSCYTCHPGAATRCLRGAMGKAIGADGNAMMSCQDCHGGMSAVGDPNRVGWLQEPNCQNCHTGDASQSAGAIRFTNAFDAPGHLRTTANQRFATDPNVPASGFSLYRFSTGHGELECSACHGSPHAIWPSSADNDNLQSVAAQGHKGTMVECSACHTNLQDNQLVGPHGMHPTGSFWVSKHQDVAEQQGSTSCAPCHGATFRGTVLSRAQGDRVLNTQFGTKTFWRGYEVGCYDCHNGPNSDNASSNTPPTVTSQSLATPTDVPLAVALTATDPNPNTLTLRIVEQPRHGAVAFDGATATYRAWDGYVGTDSFSYAAADGRANSNLGTITIAVGQPACAGKVRAFGYGCALANGTVPSLRLEGCASGGQAITWVAEGLPTSGFHFLAIGLGYGTSELTPDGCTVRLGTLVGVVDLAPQAGDRWVLPLTLPPGLVLDVTTQAFCFTASEPRGFVATPGLELDIR